MARGLTKEEKLMISGCVNLGDVRIFCRNKKYTSLCGNDVIGFRILPIRRFVPAEVRINT